MTKSIKINFPGLIILIILVISSCQSNSSGIKTESDTGKYSMDTLTQTNMTLENGKAILEINLNGGSIPDFHLKELPLNPLNWRANDPAMPAFMGHFVCFDRWGPPSEGEKANGFIHHGEVNTVIWKIVSRPQITDGISTCSMMCTLPMGNLELIRTVNIHKEEPVVFVTEEIKNLNKYGRMFNLVQHVTIAPPFLDTTTLFNNNAEKGYENKEDGRLNPEEPVIKWPETNHNGERVSLQYFRNEWPRVSSFVYNDNETYGWVTATNASKNLMIGYIWEIKDYPWINFWRSMENKVPVAFGMEFGTTGLHEPFPVIAKKGKIFGRNIYDFIDAGETIKKSYIIFLAKVQNSYNGVDKIEVSNSSIIIREKNNPSGEIRYSIK